MTNSTSGEREQRLKQIRERRAAITQGKWRWWHSQFNDLSGYVVSGEKSEGIASIVGHRDQDCAADAAFIARAPEDIDFLLSLLDGEAAGEDDDARLDAMLKKAGINTLAIDRTTQEQRLNALRETSPTLPPLPCVRCAWRR